MIANNAPKTEKLFVQGYNLEVQDVNYITVLARFLCDVISRSRVTGYRHLRSGA